MSEERNLQFGKPKRTFIKKKIIKKLFWRLEYNSNSIIQSKTRKSVRKVPKTKKIFAIVKFY